MSDKTRKEGLNPIDDFQKKPAVQSGNTKDLIKKEIDNIMKKGPLTQKDLLDLHTKYPDEDLFDEIVGKINKRYKESDILVKKLADKTWKKYQSKGYPLHVILERMLRYKKEHKMSDYEYEQFRKHISALYYGRNINDQNYNQVMFINRSRINKALGNSPVQLSQSLNIKESEYQYVNEILRMCTETDVLHKSVFMHSLIYEDCSLVAMTGEYKRDKHEASNYIHPVIACMFLPKFDIFELHMLHSNFGNIIKSRYYGKQIVNVPDNLLLNDIIRDPNDIVCEVNSPMADIRNRFKVQIKLWEIVIKLRNGSYYEASPINDFLSTLNACRNNIYDNADLAYNQDEGAILRKLLSVFSLRPTIIATRPLANLAQLSFMAVQGLHGSVSQMSNMNNMTPFVNQPVYTITDVAMITIHLPPYSPSSDNNIEPLDIRSAAVNQTMWINENKTIIPKEQSVIYSKEVLIFYANRRFQSIQIRTFTNPLNFAYTPLTMSSLEKLNAYPLYVPAALTLSRSDETYELRSVVAVNETEIRQGETVTSLITGSTGLIMTHRDFDRGIYQPRYYLYDPFGASLPVRHPNFAIGNPETEGYITNKPISQIEPVFSPDPQLTGGIPNPSFIDRASRNGTIFIYAKPTGYKYNTNESIII